MVACCVVNCSLRSVRDEGVKFYSIPSVITRQCDLTKDRTQRRRALWISRINRKDLQEKDVKYHTKVCSRHFISGKPAALHEETNPDWAPSLHLGHKELRVPDPKRHQRVQERAAKRARRESLNEVASLDVPVASAESTGENNSPRSGDLHSPTVENEDAVETVVFGDADAVVDAAVENEGVFVTFVVGDADVEVDAAVENVHSPNSQLINSLTDELEALKIERSRLRNTITDLGIDKTELRNALALEQEKVRAGNERFQQLLDQNRKLVCLENAYLNGIKGYQDRVAASDGRVKALEATIEGLNSQFPKFKRQILDLEDLKNNDKKLTFYTGLPCYEIFQAVLDLTTPLVAETSNVILAPWQSLLLTLMRLRLSLTLQDLAYRFDVSQSTACRTFEKWLKGLYASLKPTIIWPDRETLHKTMPPAFKEAFGNNVAVTIDCFEIFIARPSALDSRGMTWSNYKHHNTTKFLIGITPQGAISFISEGWGGRVSDKHIAGNCGLYDKLLPNDFVLADRGFDISEDLGLYCAKLLMPSFRQKGKNQLSALQVTDTRNIAHLRVDVERVIGLVRNKYHILQTTLPIEFMYKKNGHEVSQIDEVVLVCCALANLSPSIM